MVLLAGMCMTCRKQLVCDEQNQKVRWHEHNGSQDCNDNTLFIYQTDELHDSPMFTAAVKESGSGTCANPGLSAQIVSTPIVSTTASVLRSTPIPGYIAVEDTANDATYAPVTTGVTIPRWLAASSVDVDFPPEQWLLAARTICQAALEGEK